MFLLPFRPSRFAKARPERSTQGKGKVRVYLHDLDQLVRWSKLVVLQSVGSMSSKIQRLLRRLPYCWWFRNPAITTWYVKNPVNNGINYLSTGAGFLPSTVAPIDVMYLLKLYLTCFFYILQHWVLHKKICFNNCCNSDSLAASMFPKNCNCSYYMFFVFRSGRLYINLGSTFPVLIIILSSKGDLRAAQEKGNSIRTTNNKWASGNFTIPERLTETMLLFSHQFATKWLLVVKVLFYLTSGWSGKKSSPGL